MNSKSPAEQVEAAFNSDPLLKRGLVIAIFSTLFFAIAGGIGGFLLGYFASDYYRVMFRMPEEASTAHVGIGLGVTQGAIAGILIAIAVLFSTAWYKSRIKQNILEQVKSQGNG